MMATPLAFKSITTPNSFSVSPAERLEVGSSMMISLACMVEALAISMSCFSALLNWAPKVSGFTVRPIQSRAI